MFENEDNGERKIMGYSELIKVPASPKMCQKTGAEFIRYGWLEEDGRKPAKIPFLYTEKYICKVFQAGIGEERMPPQGFRFRASLHARKGERAGTGDIEGERPRRVRRRRRRRLSLADLLALRPPSLLHSISWPRPPFSLASSPHTMI